MKDEAETRNLLIRQPALYRPHMGHHEDAGALLDFDRFLRSFRLGPPPGYDDVATFHADLIDHIEGQQGCIEFGRPPAYFKHRSEQAIRIHRPEEGTAVLFPSYLFHGTLPAASAVKRVSIGIDMIPLARRS